MIRLGRLLDEYTDKEGVKRMNVQVITDSIEFFSSKDEQPATALAAAPEAAAKVEPIEDDLPF
jgi:single-stranded DNA-binding protein